MNWKLVIIFIFSFSSIFAQSKESEFETKGLLKTSLYPLIWSIANSNFSASLQYESQLKRKLSYNLVIDYSATPSKIFYLDQAIQQDYIFYFRPQFRKYFGDEVYKGYHLGLFPLYNFRTKYSGDKRGNYFGGGIITGYQFFIKKRYPIEINVWYALHYGSYKVKDPSTNISQTGTESFDQLGFELNIEWPIIKRK